MSDRLIAVWLSSKFFKTSPSTIIPSKVDLLIVKEVSKDYLASLIVTKKRVRFVSKKRKFLSPSCVLNYKTQTELVDKLNTDLDTDDLVIIEKSDCKFDFREFKGHIGEVEELK